MRNMGSFIKIVDMANQDAHIFKGASQASLGAGDPDIVPHCIADVCPILGNKGGIIGVFVAFVCYDMYGTVETREKERETADKLSAIKIVEEGI